MKKLYYAFVANNVNDYFKTKLGERMDEIEVVQCVPVTTSDGELILGYVLEAEEGIIDTKYELKRLGAS